MERVLILFLFTLVMLKAGESATTLGEIYLEKVGEKILDTTVKVFSHLKTQTEWGKSGVPVTSLPLKEEILEYIESMVRTIVTDISDNVASIPLQSIADDLNENCPEFSESPIEYFPIYPSKSRCMLQEETCLSFWLRNSITAELNITASVQKFSRECSQQGVSLCQEDYSTCTTAYGERVANLLSSYIKKISKGNQLSNEEPLMIVMHIVMYITRWVFDPYTSAYSYFKERELVLSSHSSIQTQEQLAEGTTNFKQDSIDLACSRKRDTNSRESGDYSQSYLLSQSNEDLFCCVNTERTSTSLTWSTVPPVYFDSQCLCLAYNGSNCGVKAPQGVDPGPFCLSVLLRDFQRQVTYRPAITYLDYSFKTPVPVCRFVNLVQVSFSEVCLDSEATTSNDNSMLPAECYFKDLVDKNVSCSEPRIVDTYNKTELCALLTFMQNVVCESDGDDVEAPPPYHMTADSLLVQFLTYGDVAVRLLTLISFLSCPQLRNLFGKLMIGYLMTSLLRLIVVRTILEDMAMAVRLDVAADFASTLCLSAYLHFLVVSIRDLRPPHSLSLKESRTVLVRSSLLAWLLPAVLSVSFFCIDDAIDSHIQIGQLLFLLCYCVTLVCNLYMLIRNFIHYYKVNRVVSEPKSPTRKRSVFVKLFVFALKTSVLSGVAIIFRLVFLQVKGLENLLVYCQALGLLQGLLVFLFYGCNYEARGFWLQVFRSILSRFSRRQNVPVSDT